MDSFTWEKKTNAAQGTDSALHQFTAEYEALILKGVWIQD